MQPSQHHKAYDMYPRRFRPCLFISSMATPLGVVLCADTNGVAMEVDDGGRRTDADAAPARSDTPGGVLPMLASACPGWVCYAEKTQGAWVLPHISSAKSPQAVQGSLVKRWLTPRLGRQLGAVYHCAVMPCFDKKLEASREDFRLPGERAQILIRRLRSASTSGASSPSCWLTSLWPKC